MSQSKFCLNPLGWTPWTLRFYQALMVRCIPVMIADDIEFPYENEIDYSEFCAAFRRSARAQQLADDVRLDLRKRMRGHREDLLTVFDEFDTNGDGVLSEDEFRRGLRQHGIRLSPAEMEQLMQVFDTNGDSTLDYREFIDAVLYESRSPSAQRSPSPRRPSPRRS